MNRPVTDVLNDLLWVAGRMHEVAGPSQRWDLSSRTLDSLYGLRKTASRERNQSLALNASLEIVRRTAEAARSDLGVKAFERVLVEMTDLLVERASRTSSARKSAMAMAGDLCGVLRHTPERLMKYVEGAQRAARPDDVYTLAGITAAEWRAFIAQVKAEAERRAEPLVDRVIGAAVVPIDLNVAERLSQAASRVADAEDGELPVYDDSDRDLKVTQVRVAGFRGSAASVTMDLTKQGRPVDVLLWGENGEGKSTLIDGLEFALQGRVDRSADFNSTLRAAVRNLSTPTAHSIVKLSDGSSVDRSLTRNEAGRDVASSDEVRPGFRIAPVVVRRADILRFLDTDALTRGTVFFDYFPHPAQSLGERPDEELKMLGEERFVLRVVRDDRARRLSELYPEEDRDFANSHILEKFVEGLLPGVDLDEFDSPSDALPLEVRDVIAEARTAQRRLAKIRSRLDKGVENLNPVAYRSQLSRVVPILLSVGDDLTASFKRIARADHVTAIKVLVAQTGPVSLDIVVDFDNGTSALPQQVFSEGYKDLIALLFFLAVTRKAAEFGQAKILVLDDALQSVDATIRFRLMTYVLEQFENWQLIITGHDKAWHEQLRMLFTRKGRAFVDRKLAGWSFDGGIGVRDSQSETDSLSESLGRHDERQTAGATGILLEEIAKELSWRVPISVPRKEGDRYTLGDLWPTLAKSLRTTSIGGIVNDITLEYDLRNAVGAHYTDWANGIPWSDIRNFAEDVLKFHRAVYCKECSDWVRRRGPRFACGCGATSFA